MVAAAILVAALLVITLLPEAFYAYVLVLMCLHALLAVSVRLVLLVGEVTLATAAFMGIGAYTAAMLTTSADMPALVSIPAGALVAGIIALAFGGIIMGTKGAYFLLITFAFTEVVRLAYTQSETVGGNSGIVGIIAGIDWLPTLIVVTTVVTIFLLYRLEVSKYGTVMSAVEGHLDLAECLGFRTRWVKTAVFALSAVVAGLSGGLSAHFNGVIAPADFGYIVSIYAIAWMVIGGRGHILGAVLGAVALTALTQELRGLGDYELLLYGLALIIATLVLPGGIWGVLSKGVDMVRGRVRPSSGPTRPDGAPPLEQRHKRQAVDQ